MYYSKGVTDAGFSRCKPFPDRESAIRHANYYWQLGKNCGREWVADSEGTTIWMNGKEVCFPNGIVNWAEVEVAQ